MYDPNAFVLYPRNRAFLEGKKRYPSAMVFFYHLAIIFSVFLFIINLILTLVMIFMGYVKISYNLQIEQNGISTQGWVKNISTSSGGDSHWLCYHFYDDKKPYSGCSLVSEEIAKQYPVATEIEILYVDTNPKISQFIHADAQIEAMVVLIIMCLGGCIFWVFVITMSYKAISKNRRLRNKGVIVKGEIDLIRGHRNFFTHFVDYLIDITVSFRTPETYEIISKKRRYVCNHLQEKPLPSIKTPIYILYVDKKEWEIL
jgi:RsiW-degrading membrane proteinase PrsW (M82 family)